LFFGKYFAIINNMSVENFSKIIVITGHYGSGKTNLAVNLALDLRKQGRGVTICDLDIVNPYFRVADFKGLAEDNGIELMLPPYANSNLDIPSLSIAPYTKFDGDGTLIIDAGGDDAGATALGRYAAKLADRQYDMLYVINRNRMQISEPKGALSLLREIETASRLKATYIVNNTHLARETTPKTVLDSIDYAKQCSSLCGLPLLFSTMRRDFYESAPHKQGLYPVDIYVDLPWV
jgi:energy-coupling factor transporter ATP-binding protein EcfA2